MREGLVGQSKERCFLGEMVVRTSESSHGTNLEAQGGLGAPDPGRGIRTGMRPGRDANGNDYEG